MKYGLLDGIPKAAHFWAALHRSPSTVLKSLIIYNHCGVRRTTDDMFAVTVSGNTDLRLAENVEIVPRSLLTIGMDENHLGNPHDSPTLHMQEGSKIIVNGPGRKTYFCHGCYIFLSKDSLLEIGENTGFNADCLLIAGKKIKIGKDCSIGWGVSIIDSDFHEHTGCKDTTRPITIGDNVWVGFEAKIMKGVTIGDGAIIGAGSVVVKDVPPKTMVAGNPASVKRQNVEWVH